MEVTQGDLASVGQSLMECDCAFMFPLFVVVAVTCQCSWESSHFLQFISHPLFSVL